MGFRARKIHALNLLFLLAALFCAGTTLRAQDISSSSYTVFKRYIFPRYNDDNEIQYIIYGATAVNKGSLIYLTTPMIDIVDGSFSSLRQIDTIDGNDPYPKAYKLGSDRKILSRFWSSSHHRHSQAWVFTEKATFDKSTNILSSDELAHFRSRQLDIVDAKDVYPKPYPLGSELSTLRSFWTHSHHRHSQAWIFADKATFDKSTNILTSDDIAHFRSRQLDADGVGFDAFNDRKFIHIRSNVRVVLRLKENVLEVEDPATTNSNKGNKS